MKNILILLLTLLFICNCIQIKEQEFTVSKIKGDWIANYFDDDQIKKTIVFSFQDSICSYLYPYGEYTKFIISYDTLIIDSQTQEDLVDNLEKYYFQIKKLDLDTLEITPITERTRSLFKYFNEFEIDNIKLIRISKNNDIELKKLCFYSTTCFGTCPSMYLEIDNTGEILFNGRYFTDIEGLFSGKIPTNELRQIFNLVQNIKLDSLKKLYSAPWTDDQTCGVKIITNLKEYESNAYGFDAEPVELRILFHKLMEIYKISDLQSDSTIVDKLWDKEFQYRGIIPPPPIITD